MRFIFLAIALSGLTAAQQNDESAKKAEQEKLIKLLSDRPDKADHQILDKEYKAAVESIVENTKIHRSKDFNRWDPETMRNTIEIIDFLYSIKNPNTLSEVAALLRNTLQEEQFTYILAVVVTHRPDVSIPLPPWYEVHPNYFVPHEILKLLKENTEEETPQPIDLPSGNTDGLDYFREDVGLNHMYYNWLIRWPSWMNRSSYDFNDWDRSGELFYYYHEQLMARYNLEKISVDQRPIIFTSWSEEIEGFEPRVANLHGEELGSRPAGLVPANLPGGDKLAEIDQNILKIAKEGTILGKDGSSISMEELGLKGVAALSDIMYNTSKSYNPDYYGSLYGSAITLIGGAGPKQDGGAIGNPMTAIRDPAFFRLLNRIVNIVQTHKKNLDVYTKAELSFEGINIETFKADDVQTFFDHFEFDAGNYLGDEATRGRHMVRQKRLNHTPLRVKLIVTNTHAQEKGAMVRLFVGPFHHLRGITFDMSRTMFVELDRFPIKLKAGENEIIREDKDFANIADERNSNKLFSDCGLPQRLAIPRGNEDGLMYMMYVMISPYEFPETELPEENTKNWVSCGRGRHDDGRAMGFPFDRPVRTYRDWIAGNHEYTNLTIYYRPS